jgi:hypothetical protein
VSILSLLKAEHYNLLTPTLGARELSALNPEQVAQPLEVQLLHQQLGYVLGPRQGIRYQALTNGISCSKSDVESGCL